MTVSSDRRGPERAPSKNEETIPARVGKYRIDRVIGRGAIGVVYKGYDEHIDRPLAIKTLRPDFLPTISDNGELMRRFALEARSAGRCLHPNIVTVFDFVEHEGAPYIVMEYVNAGTLDNVLRRGTMPPVRQVGEIMAQLLFALGYAHSKGVIHRDVKPANILCPSASSIKVSDFGVAYIESLDMTQTGLGVPIGTPNYMAPERFFGRPADARSDLFSAGVVLFQLLTGAKPFAASDLSELLKLLSESRPPSLRTFRPELWPELDDVVQKALARNPDDRYQAADAFIDALNMAIEARPPDNLRPLDLTALSHLPVTEPAAGSSTTAATKQKLNQTLAEVLPADTIDALSKTLARWLGPIARVVVKQAAREASDTTTLLDLLYGQIKGEADADAFRAAAGRVLMATTSTLEASRQAPAATPDPTRPAFFLSDADVKQVTGFLLPIVGPVATVLVTRQAAQAKSMDDLLHRLGGYIPEEDDRARLLAFASRLGRPGAV